MLAESGVGGKRELDQARRVSDGLGLFIRSLVGLDGEAATEAFSEFLVGRTLTGDQIDFIIVIIEHLTENGVMEPSRPYESPLIDRAPQGPDSLFPSADVDRLITILHPVRDNALSTAEVA